jgi:flagellar motor switch protein FliG
MEGSERAAVLLLGLGEGHAAEVIKHLEPKEVQKLGVAMAGLTGINQSQLENVYDGFLTAAEQSGGLSVDSENYVKTMLTKALGESRATSMIDRITSNAEQTGLHALKWLDSATVMDIIRGEHPQIIATILTYLDSEQAANVIAQFPEDKRVDLLVRMSSIEAIKPEALEKLGQIIEAQLAGQKGGKKSSIGGIKSVADVINYLDASVESEVLDGIKGTDETLCESIKEQMFIFENLAEVDGRSIQVLLRDISSDDLILALKGADARVKQKIFSNMSKRAAELMKDDLEAKGPVKVSEVEAAQKEILAVARRLAESGEMNLGGKGGEEMI